jgi:hypothetical protein
VFQEMASLLVPGGTLFYSEPPVIVPGREFREHLGEAADAGLTVRKRRFYFVNRAAVLQKTAPGPQ